MPNLSESNKVYACGEHANGWRHSGHPGTQPWQLAATCMNTRVDLLMGISAEAVLAHLFLNAALGRRACESFVQTATLLQ